MIETVQARLAAAPAANGPKYLVLRDAILAAISSGEWQAGTRLPTEVELAKLLPFSLGTVQKAYGELVKSGAVVRSRGRGSFVAPPDRRLYEPWHCRFLGEDGSILPVYPRVTGHEPAEQDGRWAALFGPGSAISRIDRVLAIDDEFEVVSRFYAKQSVVAALLNRPREQVETANFKALLYGELGIPITRIVQTISKPEGATWRALALPSRPHLLLEATAFTKGDIAYFQELYIPRNRRKLMFDTDFRI
jgi:GntR family transcriptional regulator